MSPSTTQQASDEAVIVALRATRAADEVSAPKRHSQRTPYCPASARFVAVAKFGDNWSDQEKAHLATECAFCEKLRRMFASAMNTVAEEDTLKDATVSSFSPAEDTITDAQPPAAGDAPKPD